MKKNKLKLLLAVLLFIGCLAKATAQIEPSKEEKIDFIVTFGKDAAGKWGDDDHCQIYFVAVPVEYQGNFYIRVFDPETGGKNDQINGVFNTQTKFSFYGGKTCYSEKDARNVDPVGNYKSGVLITSKVFSEDKALDNAWYSFGPFNPQEGEYDADLKSNVFKIIVEGMSGDDGNAYRLSLTKEAEANIPISNSNFFAYEVCFRLINKTNEAAHLYPFINANIAKVKEHNFDFDNDGYIRVNSVVKKAHDLTVSGDNEWKSSEIEITNAEINTSLDLYIIKGKDFSNDLTIYLTDQFKQAVPFFSSPIGGIPKYKYKVDVNFDVK